MELDVHTSAARPGLINSVQSGCFAKPLSGASISQVDAAPSAAARPFITLCIFQFNCAEEKKSQPLALAPPPRLGPLMNLFCYFRRYITARLD